jgi:hypothetical protein
MIKHASHAVPRCPGLKEQPNVRHSFSAEFLKVLPPATNFGEAWENLCLCLLRADTCDPAIMRLAPPDRGIDILRQSTGSAYQCKSSERGIFGIIEAQECIKSIKRALDARKDVPWSSYFIAINAPLTGVGLGKINQFASSAGVPPNHLVVLPPEYWNALCEQHESKIRDLFDYRVFISEAQVIEAFHKARYYDRFINKAVTYMADAPLNMVISNNRTPVELALPFSGDLTVEQLLDVIKSLLGVTTDWVDFPDLGTSCGTSLSMTIDRSPQPFRMKLSELSEEQRAKLQFWIKLVWRDGLQKGRDHDDDTIGLHSYREGYSYRRPASETERRQMTLSRMGALVQTKIWQSLPPKI